MQKRIKVGLNEPCPCGSGKKYKKCCRLSEESKSAQLSTLECILFYETWLGLLSYVNEKKKVINSKIKPVYPNSISDEQLYKVREVLWENPHLINDYLDAVGLPAGKIELLESWRDHYIKGMFFLLDYKPEYAVVVGSDEQMRDRLYGVKGLSRPLSDVMRRELPVQIETVLLPFKDRIIFDSYMVSMSINFQGGAKRAFDEIYKNALKHGIITSLIGML